MPNQELLSYIKKQLEKNISKDIVRQALLKAGWPIVDIESAFLELEKRTATPSIAKSDAQLTSQQKELKETVKANPDYYHIEKKIEQKPATNFQSTTQPIAGQSTGRAGLPTEKVGEVKNVEKIFNHGIAKAEPQKTFNQTLKPESSATVIKKNDLPRTSNAIKGIMIGALAFVISAFSAYLYIFWTEIKDPMFLIPSNNDAVVVLNTDLASPQWTKTRELINRIPFGAKALDELAKNGLLTGSIKQIIGFANIDTTKGGVLIEFSNEVDSKAIQSLKDFLETKLSATEETEKYQNFEIKKILQDNNYDSPLFNFENNTAKETLVGAYVQLGNKVAFSNDIEQIRLIIGNYKKANLASVFSKGSIKGIKSASSFKKLKKYIPKEYLLWGYANIDLKNINPITLEKNIKGFELKDALLASLSSIKTSTSNGALFYVLANDNGFVSKQFAVGDLTSAMDDFDTSKSLAQSTNSQIGSKEITLYSEIKNLSKYFKELEKQQSSSYQVKADYVFNMIKENIGIDIAQIIDDVNGQASVSAYFNKSADGMPLFLNIKIQSSNASQIDKVLSELNIKNATAGSMMKMNDASLMSYMTQIATQAEVYRSEKGFYPYYLGSSLKIKELSETIKEYTPDKSAIALNSSGAKYCTYVKLNADNLYFCIDSDSTRGLYSFDQIDQSCKKGTYLCPNADNQKEQTYAVQSNKFSDIGVGNIKTLPILFDNILLGYSVNDNVVNFIIGSKTDIESFANANLQKVSDMQDYKDTIGNNKNIKSVIFFKPGAIIDNYVSEVSGIGAYKESLMEIFPLISGVSYTQDDILISDSQIQIKDIGKERIKSAEEEIGK